MSDRRNLRFTLTLLVLLIGLGAVAQAWAVDCTPGDITLSSQADVDDFQTNHGPGCDRVTGTFTITGADITNLNGLSGLTSVYWVNLTGNPLLTDISGLSNLTTFTGPFFISNNSVLTNLTGLSGMVALTGGALIVENNPLLSDLSALSGLVSINASLSIQKNDSLTDLDDFASLTSVSSNINIGYNDALVSLAGLSGLAGFTAGIDLRFNSMLPTLNGLQGLTDIRSLVLFNNDALLDVDGLDNVTSIGNGSSALFISNNAVLADVDGLGALVSLDADLEITDNPMLSLCSALATLLDVVDDAVAGPGPGAAGIPDVNGDVMLSGNLPGCNSVSDITGAPPPMNQPPVASFSFTCIFLSCDFDGSGSSDADGTVSAWDWDFGDGAMGSGEMASHVVAAAGNYVVQLTVTDDDAATGFTTQTVSVSAAPPPPPPPPPPAPAVPVPTLGAWQLLLLVLGIGLVGAGFVRRQ